MVGHVTELPVVLHGRVHITVMVGSFPVCLVSESPSSFDAGDAPAVVCDEAFDVASRYLRENPDEAHALYLAAAAMRKHSVA